MDRIETPLAEDEEEFDDPSMARTVVFGALIGIPLALVVVALEVLLAGEGLGTALEVALWPALVAGPYLGGFIVLITLATRMHREAEIHRITTRAAPKVARPAA